jgi:hypothetical protein
MNKTKLRQFALMVLDDENGIREDAYNILAELLQDNNSGDLLNAVEVDKDRAFIGENIAEECLADIGKWEESFNVLKEFEDTEEKA